MNEEELRYKKIYKNANPSSIIDYVGGNLTRINTQPTKHHMLNYTRNRNNIYSSSSIEQKDSPPKQTQLNTVIERIVTDEESSCSFNSKKSKDTIKSHKNVIKQFRTINSNYQFNINNSNIYGSSNKIYNYNTSKKSIRNNKYFLNLSRNIDTNKDLYSPFQDERYSYKNNSRSFKSSNDEDRSEFFLNKIQDSDEENEIKKIIKYKHKDFQKRAKQIKIRFYVIISIFYFSLYLLCLKMSLQLSMPEIPSLGVSSFIISFNNLLISVLFIKLDQINFSDFISLEKFGSYAVKINFNYIRILLTIKSLQHIKLLSFIVILNMTPLIVSYISIRENNKAYKASDSFYYFLFFIICLSEFIVHNKISTLCTFILIIINTFTSMTRNNIVKNIHSYLIDFGSSVIGVAISPLIMSLNEDSLNISISQYLLFTIICFTYFLNHYFESKFTDYSLGQGYQMTLNAIIIFLCIIYSNFILRETNHLNSYLYLGLSFIINIYGKLRIESTGF